MEVVLAVIYRKGKRYADGLKPVAIPYKSDFRRYVRYNRSEVWDECLVILRGGTSCTATVEQLRGMEWMREN